MVINKLIQSEFLNVIFDCLDEAKYGSGKVWLKISLPPTLNIDWEKIKSIFDTDLDIIWWQKNGFAGRTLKGTIKDEELSKVIVIELAKIASQT